MALRLLEAVIPAAHAQEPRIDISSPAIKRLTASMEQRHRRLQPHYESGAIGLTRDALIEVRDLGSVPLAQRGEVRQLVAAENNDRNALYREIAVANEHPEWEDQIRDVFAERWIGNARPGWYSQNEAGEWVRKSAHRGLEPGPVPLRHRAAAVRVAPLAPGRCGFPAPAGSAGRALVRPMEGTRHGRFTVPRGRHPLPRRPRGVGGTAGTDPPGGGAGGPRRGPARL
ncbi:MAG: YdbL family protein [Arhodomonas sp.]|nr:YdbL family protein [Arhodomonas sp.]